MGRMNLRRDRRINEGEKGGWGKVQQSGVITEQEYSWDIPTNWSEKYVSKVSIKKMLSKMWKMIQWKYIISLKVLLQTESLYIGKWQHINSDLNKIVTNISNKHQWKILNKRTNK